MNQTQDSDARAMDALAAQIDNVLKKSQLAITKHEDLKREIT